MNIFKWFKTSKKDLELELVKLESKERHTIEMLNRAKTSPWYLVDDLIDYRTKIDVLKYKIENYED